MEPTTTEILLDALKRAEEAHGAYEAEVLGGVRDDEWPQWYAEHMTRTLSENGYRLTRLDPQ
jgi:hypothetical protein